MILIFIIFPKIDFKSKLIGHFRGIEQPDYNILCKSVFRVGCNFHNYRQNVLIIRVSNMESYITRLKIGLLHKSSTF